LFVSLSFLWGCLHIHDFLPAKIGLDEFYRSSYQSWLGNVGHDHGLLGLLEAFFPSSSSSSSSSSLLLLLLILLFFFGRIHSHDIIIEFH
jgi:hypothetical protein